MERRQRSECALMGVSQPKGAADGAIRLDITREHVSKI
jgi:hypothetical protein